MAPSRGKNEQERMKTNIVEWDKMGADKYYSATLKGTLSFKKYTTNDNTRAVIKNTKKDNFDRHEI